jgi:hypothetical protein
MSNLINSIVNRNFVEADSIVSEAVELIMAKKLEEAKKMCAAKMDEQIPAFMGAAGSNAVKLRRGVLEEDDVEEAVDPAERTQVSVEKSGPKQEPGSTHYKDAPGSTHYNTNMKEEDQLDEARIKIVKARIRGGKIQRRKKISNVPGMTIRSGKLQRMSAAERRRRKLGARKAVRKRAPKMNRALMKRKRSLMKRRALGI